MGEIQWEEEHASQSSPPKKPQHIYLESLDSMLPKMEEGTQIMTCVIFELQQGQWKQKKSWNKVTFPTPKQTSTQQSLQLQEQGKEWDV